MKSRPKSAETYQDRIREVVAAAGGFTPLARAVTDLLPEGQSVSYQAIQHLAQTAPSPAQEEKGGWKPAQGSNYDAAMAHVTGYQALWLSHGIGPKRTGDPPIASAQWGAKLVEKGYTPEEVAEALGVSADEAKSIIRGEMMPAGKDQIRKLSTLLNLSPTHLANPRSGGPLAEAERVTAMQLSPDERHIVEIYRKLKPFGKRAMRVRVTELQQEFLPKDKTNPWGEKWNAN